jgi:hypothetical protein
VVGMGVVLVHIWSMYSVAISDGRASRQDLMIQRYESTLSQGGVRETETGFQLRDGLINNAPSA